MFEIQNTLSFNNDKLVDGKEFDYVTRTSKNQGILSTTGFINEANINPAGNWSLGLLQMNFFYRKKPWYAGQFVRKITSKINLTENLILFFSVILNNLQNKLLSVLVRDVDNTFLNSKIQLPTKKNQPDFEFMESFIAELEAYHIAELEAYLLASGFENYKLTKAENQALTDFKNGVIHWQKFRIGDLFEIGTGSLLSTDELVHGTIKRISAKSDNNGILGEFNTINNTNARHFENFISVNFFGTDGGIFYHSYKASVEMKVHTLKIPNFEFNNKTGIFIASTLKQALGGFSYGNQLSSSKLKKLNFNIQLPTKNNQIDFEFMESFISAIQKLVIKDVVIYSKQKIETTKKIVN